MSPKPRTRRAAIRSLVFETTAEGDVIVGSKWFQTRILGKSKEQCTDAALRVWAGTLVMP